MVIQVHRNVKLGEDAISVEDFVQLEYSMQNIGLFDDDDKSLADKDTSNLEMDQSLDIGFSVG